MSTASMSARSNSFCRGLARVFGKVFAFRFVAAYEVFDTYLEDLQKCVRSRKYWSSVSFFNSSVE